MTGYDGSHQDWLEGQASDQLEREEFERAGGFRARRVEIGGVNGEVVFAHGDGFLSIVLHQASQPIAHFSMDHDIAIRFANAILSEVEIAQRGEG